MIKLEFNHYYVAEISFFRGNPIARYIVRCQEVKNGYTGEPIFELGFYHRTISPGNANYFEIISEITDMNKRLVWMSDREERI